MNFFETKNQNVAINLNEIAYIAKHFNRDNNSIVKRQTNKIDICFKSGAGITICCKTIKERDEQYNKLINALTELLNA